MIGIRFPEVECFFFLMFFFSKVNVKCVYYAATIVEFHLVGSLEHFIFSIIYGMSSFPLTKSYFSEGSNHQPVIVGVISHWKDRQSSLNLSWPAG